MTSTLARIARITCITLALGCAFVLMVGAFALRSQPIDISTPAQDMSATHVMAQAHNDMADAWPLFAHVLNHCTEEDASGPADNVCVWDASVDGLANGGVSFIAAHTTDGNTAFFYGDGHTEVAGADGETLDETTCNRPTMRDGFVICTP